MIQTVTGAVEKSDFGTVLMHEHIGCSSTAFMQAFGEKWLDRSRLRSLSCEALTRMKKKYGLGLFVDATPIDVGRDALLLREISLLTDVKIVMSTGLYCLPSIETENNSPEELAEFFIDECKNGVGDTGIKPGILKCATGSLGITEDNRKKLSLMGIVQRETHLPLYVHCEHSGDIARGQLEILLENGAEAGKIIIGHTAIRPDKAYLEGILKSGVCICMDQCYCYPQYSEAIAEALVFLCERGYTDKILLSNDYCIYNDFCNRRRSGLLLDAERHVEGFSYVLETQYRDFLSAGGKERDFRVMLRQNSVNILDTE